MGLVEAIATLACITGVLTAAVATSNSLRTNSAESQTRATLVELRQALTAYQKAHGELPTGETPRVLTTLLQDPASRAFMEKLYVSFDQDHHPIVYDGYGRAVRYYGPEEKPPQGPDFVSAGPDKQFGDLNGHSPQAIDDLRGVDYQVVQP